MTLQNDPADVKFDREVRLRDADGFAQNVNSAGQQATTTTLTSSANPSVFGQTVNFTAIVRPTSGTGTT